MKMGGLFSSIKDTKIHITLAVFWVFMTIPTLMFWKDSVAVVLIYSVYALVAAHIAAYEGAKNDDKIDQIVKAVESTQIVKAVESTQVKCYHEGMRNYFPDPTGYASNRKSKPEYQDEIKAFAEKLHSQYCKLGHEDNCTWFFENDWSKWAHKRWFDKAEELMSSGAPKDLILDIINTFRKM